MELEERFMISGEEMKEVTALVGRCSKIFEKIEDTMPRIKLAKAGVV